MLPTNRTAISCMQRSILRFTNSLYIGQLETQTDVTEWQEYVIEKKRNHETTIISRFDIKLYTIASKTNLIWKHQTTVNSLTIWYVLFSLKLVRQVSLSFPFVSTNTQTGKISSSWRCSLSIEHSFCTNDIIIKKNSFKIPYPLLKESRVTIRHNFYCNLQRLEEMTYDGLVFKATSREKNNMTCNSTTRWKCTP